MFAFRDFRIDVFRVFLISGMVASVVRGKGDRQTTDCFFSSGVKLAVAYI